jgi:hypothetical protein
LESLSNSIFLAAAVRRKRLKDKKNAKWSKFL